MKTLLFAVLALTSTPAFAQTDWDQQRKAHISCDRIIKNEVIMCRARGDTYNGMKAYVTDKFYDMNGQNTLSVLSFRNTMHVNALRHEFRLDPACDLGVCKYYSNAKVGLRMHGGIAYVTIVR